MQVLPYEYDMSSILVWVAQGGQNTFWNRSGPFLNGVWLVSLWCLTGTLTLETFCTFCQTLLHTLSICYVSSSSITSSPHALEGRRGSSTYSRSHCWLLQVTNSSILTQCCPLNPSSYIRGCSHITSAKLGVFWQPLSPRQQWSAFAGPLLPPSPSIVIYANPLSHYESLNSSKNTSWHFNGLRCVLDLCFVLALHSKTKFILIVSFSHIFGWLKPICKTKL